MAKRDYDFDVNAALNDSYYYLASIDLGTPEYERAVNSVQTLENIKRANDGVKDDPKPSAFEKVFDKVIDACKVLVPIGGLVIAESFATRRQHEIMEYERTEVLRTDAAKELKKSNFDCVKTAIGKIKL